MNFQIEQLVLFRKNHKDTKVYEFKTGKLNMVTGSSATGKSSFLKIIDYVLCSRTCAIPDYVLTKTDWVGLWIAGTGKRYFIARRTPGRNQAKTDEFYFKEYDISIERPKIEALRTTNDIKSISGILDVIAGVGLEEKQRDTSLSFRDVLNLSIQSSRTIASEEELFEHSSNPAIQKILSKRFPLLLGIDDTEVIGKERLAAQKETELKELIARKNEAERIMQNWWRSLKWDISEAKIYSFISADLPEATDPIEIQAMAENILEKSKEFKYPTASNDGLAKNLELVLSLKHQAEEKADEIQQLQQQAKELEELGSRVREFHEEAEKTRDQLQIVEWLKRTWDPNQRDFFSKVGPNTEQAAYDEYNRLFGALKSFNSSIMNADIYKRAIQTIEAKLKKLNSTRVKRVNEYNEIMNQVNQIEEHDHALEDARISAHKAFALRGRIESAHTMFKSINSAELSKANLDKIDADIASLREEISSDRQKFETQIEASLEYISQTMKEHLDHLPVEARIKGKKYRLDTDNFDIEITYGGDEVCLLSRLGSSANHLYFHIAFTCALQQLLSARGETPIANLVIYEETDMADAEARDLNKEIAMAIQASENPWQAIVLLKGNRMNFEKEKLAIHSVAHFDANEGIIPKEWS